MTISDDLRRAADVCLGPRAMGNPSTDARRLLSLYRRRVVNEQQRRGMDEAVADAELGVAAYSLGVHYQVQNRPDQAEHWLRAAAVRDVADAAVRLAMLYEFRSVMNANTTVHPTAAVDDDLTAARYWYQVGAAAGYTVGDDGQPTDSTPMTLDCCPQVQKAAGAEIADEIIAAARRDADVLLRQARADVKVIVDAARGEVDDLARQRADIEDQMKHLRHLVNGIAAAGSTTPARRRSRRPGRPREADTEAEAWALMLDHFQQQEATPRSRHVLRSLITRIMTIFENTHEPEALDLDVETKDAVPSQFPPPPWTGPNATFHARAG